MPARFSRIRRALSHFRPKRSSYRRRRFRRFGRRNPFRGRSRFSRRFKRFGRRGRSSRRRYRRKMHRSRRSRQKFGRRYRRSSQKAGRSRRLPFALRTISTESFQSIIGEQTWFDVPALGDPIYMMQELMNDALSNLVKIKAARDPISRVQGLNYPWNADTSSLQHGGAIIAVDDINPKYFNVTFKEIIKYAMYNVSNTTAYMTIIKMYPRRSTKETGYGCWQQTLAVFPTTSTNTPLTSTSANNGHLIKSKNMLNWGYPDYDQYGSTGTAGSIIPFQASKGPNEGVLAIPRQYGAFEIFFPPDPWPALIQQNAGNAFNQSNKFALNTLAPGAGTSSDGSAAYQSAYFPTTELLTESSGSSPDPAYYSPAIMQDYFRNTAAVPPPAGANPNSNPGQRAEAYQTINYTTNRSSTTTSASSFVDNPPSQSSYISGVPLGVDGATAKTAWGPQIDPFGPELGGSGTNWSTHPQYNEMKNRCMRMLFKMYQKRVSIAPGKVLRWTLRGKRTTINPVRDRLMVSTGPTSTVPSVFCGTVNGSKTIAGWGTDVTSASSTGGSGGGAECPSMWGPEYPCRTVLWSCSIRGQTAAKGGGNIDIAQIMPTEILVKKDHNIRYNVSYKPVTPQLRKHQTIRNYLEYNPTVTNYRIQYPIAGVIAGGAGATTNTLAEPTTVN